MTRNTVLNEFVNEYAVVLKHSIINLAINNKTISTIKSQIVIKSILNALAGLP